MSLSKTWSSFLLNGSELTLLLFGLLLVVGLIGEYKLHSDSKWYKRCEMFVIIGVAGELLADGAIFTLSSHLETLSGIEIAALNREANFARDAAMLERYKREVMESISLPRRLDDSRRDDHIELLRPFSGTKFIVVTLSDSEPRRVGERITRLLVSSGWLPETPVRYVDADDRQMPDGVFIEANGPIHGPPASPLKPAMEALKRVLDENHIDASMSFLNPWLPPQKLPENTLRIVIGLKPDPYLLTRLKEEDRRLRSQRQK